MQAFLIEKIEEISFEEVGVDDSLWESGVIDYITIVELAVEIEGEFNIEIHFDEIVGENIETISRLMTYIDRRQNSN